MGGEGALAREGGELAVDVSLPSLFSSASEWEGSLLALFKEHGDTWNPTPGNKLYEREQLLSKKMAEVSHELAAVECLCPVAAPVLWLGL